jgi:ABC-type transport system involved in multi-copper enzyme maturation permease subunit
VVVRAHRAARHPDKLQRQARAQSTPGKNAGLSAHMSKVLAIARFTLLEALRTRLLWLVLGLLVLLIVGSLFVRQLAITDTARMQLGFLAASMRLGMVLILCLHVAGSMAREFNDKNVDLLLSLDLPRAGYFLGKLLGFVGVALLMALLASAALGTVADPVALVIWGTSLACELVIVAAITLFCAITFVQIMPAVTFVVAFYLLARSIAAVRLMSGSQLLPADEWSTRLTGWLVDGLALLLPDLSRFTSSAWLLGGADGGSALAYVVAQTLIYGALLSLAGLFDLYRRSL